MEIENRYALYILMRTDLASLNPGKAMAQSNHAYGALKKRVRSHIVLQPKFIEWMGTTEQEFGTTLVLGAKEGEIKLVLDRASRYFGKTTLSGWVYDPTYPVCDGEITHLVPLNTCAFLFASREDSIDLVGHLDLHP
jgi:hypothetical protein